MSCSILKLSRVGSVDSPVLPLAIWWPHDELEPGFGLANC